MRKLTFAGLVIALSLLSGLAHATIEFGPIPFDWSTAWHWTDPTGDNRPAGSTGTQHAITDITDMWLGFGADPVTNTGSYTFLRLDLNSEMDGVDFVAGIALNADRDPTTGRDGGLTGSGKDVKAIPSDAVGIDYTFYWDHDYTHNDWTKDTVVAAIWNGTSWTLADTFKTSYAAGGGKTSLTWQFETGGPLGSYTFPTQNVWNQFCGFTRETNLPTIDKLCVPEPGTYALLALALGVPFYFRRRKS